MKQIKNKRDNRTDQSENKILNRSYKKKKKNHTEAVINEVVKSVAVAIVSELVVTRRKFLETLSSYAGEVSGELRVLS